MDVFVADIGRGMDLDCSYLVAIWWVSLGHLVPDLQICMFHSASGLMRVGREVAGEWRSSWESWLLREAGLCSESSASREDGWKKWSLLVCFRSLMKLEEMWLESVRCLPFYCYSKLWLYWNDFFFCHLILGVPISLINLKYFSLFFLMIHFMIVILFSLFLSWKVFLSI